MLKNAKLRNNACVEEIDYRTARGLDKNVVRTLVQESAWVAKHENVFVLGPTGVGKSSVAFALAKKACPDGCSPTSGLRENPCSNVPSLFEDSQLTNEIPEST